jgi:hypothetical protein
MQAKLTLHRIDLVFILFVQIRIAPLCGDGITASSKPEEVFFRPRSKPWAARQIPDAATRLRFPSHR